jgi:hypothetical protein
MGTTIRHTNKQTKQKRELYDREGRGRDSVEAQYLRGAAESGARSSSNTPARGQRAASPDTRPRQHSMRRGNRNSLDLQEQPNEQPTTKAADMPLYYGDEATRGKKLRSEVLKPGTISTAEIAPKGERSSQARARRHARGSQPTINENAGRYNNPSAQAERPTAQTPRKPSIYQGPTTARIEQPSLLQKAKTKVKGFFKGLFGRK